MTLISAFLLFANFVSPLSKGPGNTAFPLEITAESPTLATKDQADMANLNIRCTELRGADAPVVIALYRNPDNFLSDNIYLRLVVPGLARQVADTTVRVPTGKYAIALYQDINGDGKLSRNFIGFPTEPYGFSNNYVPRFSKPEWNDAVFTLRGDREVEIGLNR